MQRLDLVIRRKLSGIISPEIAREPTRKIRGKSQKFTAFTQRAKNRKLAAKMFTIYEQGGAIAMAIDIWSLFVVTNEPRVVCEDEKDQAKIDAWWDNWDPIGFLQDSVRWALIYGAAEWEKLPAKGGADSISDLGKLSIADLAYIDGRTVDRVISDTGVLEAIVQKFPHGDGKTFKPEEIVRIVLIPSPDGINGISLLNRNLDNIKNFVKSQVGIANFIWRHGFSKFHVQVKPAVEGQPVPERVLDEYEKTFRDINSKNEFVTDDKATIIEIDKGTGGNLKGINEWGLNQLNSGLGVPEEFLGLGRGSTEATAKVKAKAFERYVGAIRHRLSKQFELQVLKPVKADLGVSGKCSLDFPDINPDDEAAKAEWIAKLMPAGTPNLIFTVDEIREKMGDGPFPEDAEEEPASQPSVPPGMEDLADLIIESDFSKAPIKDPVLCTCGTHMLSKSELQAAQANAGRAKRRPEDERQRLTDKFQMPLQQTENRVIGKVTAALTIIENRFSDFLEEMLEGKTMQQPTVPAVDAGKLSINIKLKKAEQRLITDAFRTELEESFVIGAGSAASAVGRGEGAIARTAVLDAEAAAWLDVQSALVTSQLMDPTITAMRFQLVEGLRNGESVAKISDRMATVFNGTRAELDRISRTEIQRAANEGRITGYEQLGVSQVEFLVTTDDVTCAQCLAFDGKVMSLDEARNLIPLHPNCVLPDNEVSGAFVSGLKSYYSGPALEIMTRGGKKLTVTPNHPILSSDGFVPAEQLREGQDLVCHSNWDKSLGNPDDKENPPTIKDVFEMLSDLGVRETMPLASEDLHGDARWVDGDVDVIRPKGSLRSNMQAKITKGRGQFQLISGDTESSLLTGNSPLGLSGERVCPASGGSPCSLKLALDSIRAPGLDSLPLQPLRLGVAADMDSLVPELSSESYTKDSGKLRELIHRHPSLIELDPIIEIRPIKYSGHVYDLQTDSGYYVASGVFIHNCRCTFIPVTNERAA